MSPSRTEANKTLGVIIFVFKEIGHKLEFRNYFVGSVSGR